MKADACSISRRRLRFALRNPAVPGRDLRDPGRMRAGGDDAAGVGVRGQLAPAAGTTLPARSQPPGGCRDEPGMTDWARGRSADMQQHPQPPAIHAAILAAEQSRVAEVDPGCLEREAGRQAPSEGQLGLEGDG